MVAPAPVPKLTIDIAVGAVVAVLVIVKLLSVPPLLLPSIITLSAPFNLIKAPLETLPANAAVTLVAGLMVSVNEPLQP